MNEITPLAPEQMLRLETAVAVVESALEDLDAIVVQDIDPLYRLLISMSGTQLRLGTGTMLATVSLNGRLQGGGHVG